MEKGKFFISCGRYVLTTTNTMKRECKMLLNTFYRYIMFVLKLYYLNWFFSYVTHKGAFSFLKTSKVNLRNFNFGIS